MRAKAQATRGARGRREGSRVMAAAQVHTYARAPGARSPILRAPLELTSQSRERERRREALPHGWGRGRVSSFLRDSPSSRSPPVGGSRVVLGTAIALASLLRRSEVATTAALTIRFLSSLWRTMHTRAAQSRRARNDLPGAGGGRGTEDRPLHLCWRRSLPSLELSVMRPTRTSS